MSLIEEFIVRMYTSKLEAVASVNRARYEMFTYSGKDFDHIPPTKNALELHTLRAAGTTCQIYLLHRSRDMNWRTTHGIPSRQQFQQYQNSTWPSVNAKRSANHHASAHQRLCAALPCVPVGGVLWTSTQLNYNISERCLNLFFDINYICIYV